MIFVRIAEILNHEKENIFVNITFKRWLASIVCENCSKMYILIVTECMFQKRIFIMIYTLLTFDPSCRPILPTAGPHPLLPPAESRLNLAH